MFLNWVKTLSRQLLGVFPNPKHKKPATALKPSQVNCSKLVQREKWQKQTESKEILHTQEQR
jgi:hypothetical protein